MKNARWPKVIKEDVVGTKQLRMTQHRNGSTFVNVYSKRSTEVYDFGFYYTPAEAHVAYRHLLTDIRKKSRAKVAVAAS